MYKTCRDAERIADDVPRRELSSEGSARLSACLTAATSRKRRSAGGRIMALSPWGNKPAPGGGKKSMKFFREVAAGSRRETVAEVQANGRF